LNPSPLFYNARLFMALAFFLFFLSGFSQNLTQTIRGRVIDRDSKASLPGATVILTSDTINLIGATTNERGEFRLENITVGRHSLKVSFVGYKPLFLSGLIVTVGKEVIVTAELEESVMTMEQFEVAAHRKDQAMNEMAIVSARAFDVEETERYAGSRGDPARMASNFAGVQGGNDTRNDIIVRGNSPMGILWRLEDIDIPNPNHFAVPGTTGGPVSILNNKVLGNSDFLTGAFPAEFGNSTAGVFDVKMRPGNNEKHEFTGQFGFLGTELTAEGPISKESRSSYIFNYRYSTLKLFETFNIPIGTSAVPNYQDASFKLNFPMNKGNLSFFGVGGKSNIDIVLSKFTEPTEEMYGDKDRDQYFGSSMGFTGASYTHYINSTAYTKISIAASYSEAHTRHDLINRDTAFNIQSIEQILGYKTEETKVSASWFINKKFSSRHAVKSGFFVHRFHYNMHDSIFSNAENRFITRLDHKGQSFLIQPYGQWRYRFSDDIEFTAGVHGQYFELNGSSSIEPRGGIKWTVNPKNSLSFGVGMHSQLQPSYIYFHQVPLNEGFVQHNKNLGFSRSNHYVLSFDHYAAKNLRFRTEAYYQQLYNLPVEIKPSPYSVLNQGTGFSRFFPDSLKNTGLGTNYGIEFTVERFFSRSYFFLLTASIYSSTYKGSDGIERNTDYNGLFASNILAGREVKSGKNSTFGFSGKITWAGGRRYTPVDVNASLQANEAVYIDALTNTRQFRDYFRTDLRIYYRINSKKLTHEIALDMVNVFNTRNVLALSFAPDPRNPMANPVREEYQLGFLPLFYYKIDF
jgi:hypothetical protein